MATAESVQLADESQDYGDQLIARGEYALKLGRDLLRQAALLRGEIPQEQVARPDGPSADHSVGRHGLVDEKVARERARTLGVFTRLEFEDALGLKGPATSKWLLALIQAGALVREIRESDGATVHRYCLPLEAESARYQLQVYCSEHREKDHSTADLVEALGLSDEEVEAGITELVALGALKPTSVSKVSSTGEIGELGQTRYHWVPSLDTDSQLKLEQARRAAMSAPAVLRGEEIRLKRKNPDLLKPGYRQKAANKDRNRSRMEAAKAHRDELAARRSVQPRPAA